MNAEAVPCNVLNMEFFDRLWVRGVVRDGEMVKSKPDSWGDVPCKDDVRKVSIHCLWKVTEKDGLVSSFVYTVSAIRMVSIILANQSSDNS